MSTPLDAAPPGASTPPPRFLLAALRSPQVRARLSALRQLADIETTHRAHLSHARARVCDTRFHHQTVGNHTLTLQFAAHSGETLEQRPAPNPPLFPIRYGHQNKPFVFSSIQNPRGHRAPLQFPAVTHVNALAFGVTSTFPAARTDRPGAQRFNSRHIKSISVQVPRRILRIWMKPPNSLLFR